MTQVSEQRKRLINNMKTAKTRNKQSKSRNRSVVPVRGGSQNLPNGD